MPRTICDFSLTSSNIHLQRHLISVITAYIKINLSWKLPEKSIQNRTCNLPTLWNVYQYVRAIYAYSPLKTYTNASQMALTINPIDKEQNEIEKPSQLNDLLPSYPS